MTQQKKICVFCGSRPGKDPVYEKSATSFGQALARNGHTLVFGGGDCGLMGSVAHACHDGGGAVIGVMPEALVSVETPFSGCSELIVTDSMHERKRAMFERSDAFVVFPGGIGTLEELVEVASWRHLTFHHKPIILANINDYWAPFETIMHHIESVGFIAENTFASNGDNGIFHKANTVEDILPLIDRILAQTPTVEDSAKAVGSKL